jgi:hypothetical protein
MSTVTMNGPSFDGSGKIVEREVPVADVRAYKAAGYVEGALPKAEKLPEPPKEIKMVEVVEEAPKKDKKGKK